MLIGDVGHHNTKGGSTNVVLWGKAPLTVKQLSCCRIRSILSILLEILICTVCLSVVSSKTSSPESLVLGIRSSISEWLEKCLAIPLGMNSKVMSSALAVATTSKASP